MERTGPHLGSLQVRAIAFQGDHGWVARAAVWRLRQPLQADEVMTEVSTGPYPSGAVALDQAYERAHAEAMRILLQTFACY